ncbi:peptidoglycan editing factor PgeF [Solibacillus sp. CAU 1738]|uniref:peptidoglycan editing factor PgeF n=1 Tax=Solibacillus sp. CAU 1738 TaxID=3140363 RepID=UPI0032601736
MKTYINNENFLAGITVKENTNEENNTALHICQSIDVVQKNRQELAAQIGYTLDDFVCTQQTHSANFYKVTAADKGKGAYSLDTAIEDTDALYTYEKGIVLTSFTADCVPVILTNAKTGLIGVVHSGWQGSVKEITLKLLQHVILEGNNPRDLHITIGMALSQDKFEVDEDVYLKFKALGYADQFMYYNESTNKYHIDNQLTVKKQCELAGIPTEQITVDSTCTFNAINGFSYRQDKQCGRHLTFVVRK